MALEFLFFHSWLWFLNEIFRESEYRAFIKQNYRVSHSGGALKSYLPFFPFLLLGAGCAMTFDFYVSVEKFQPRPALGVELPLR